MNTLPETPSVTPTPATQAANGRQTRHWNPIADPTGRFERVPKTLLHVDHTYQRDSINRARITHMASNWSWLACGILLVVRRADGFLYIVDGQHRHAAGKLRDDVDLLPCLVFDAASLTEEAQAFIDVNCRRLQVNFLAKFKAMLTAKDPTALAVNRLIEASRYHVGFGQADWNVKCVGTIVACWTVDPAVTTDVWNFLAAEFYAGQSVQERPLKALFSLERFQKRKGAPTIFSRQNRELLVAAGHNGVARAIAMAIDFLGRGGTTTYAIAVANLINKRRRTNLVLVPNDSTDEPETPEGD